MKKYTYISIACIMSLAFFITTDKYQEMFNPKSFWEGQVESISKELALAKAELTNLALEFRKERITASIENAQYRNTLRSIGQSDLDSVSDLVYSSQDALENYRFLANLQKDLIESLQNKLQEAKDNYALHLFKLDLDSKVATNIIFDAALYSNARVIKLTSSEFSASVFKVPMTGKWSSLNHKDMLTTLESLWEEQSKIGYLEKGYNPEKLTSNINSKSYSTNILGHDAVIMEMNFSSLVRRRDFLISVNDALLLANCVSKGQKLPIGFEKSCNSFLFDSINAR